MSKPKPKSLYELVDWLRQEPDMAALADELDAMLDQVNGPPILPNLVAAIPGMSRDKKRQAGTQQPRRRDINDWIAAQIARMPAATRAALWERAPQWITDQIGKDRFIKRVSKIRAMSR